MKKQYTLSVPVKGCITVTFDADSPEEAIDQFIDNQEHLLTHQYCGVLDPEMDSALIYETNIKYKN